MIRMFNGSVKNLRGSYALNSQTNKWIDKMPHKGFRIPTFISNGWWLMVDGW
jgi:hypothetical protein